MNEIVIPIVTGMFLLGGGFLTFLGTRGKTQTDARVALDGRLDERLAKEIARLDARIDEQDGEIAELKASLQAESRGRSAATRVIRSMVVQWPGPPYPRINPHDAAQLDADTIPPHWA